METCQNKYQIDALIYCSSLKPNKIIFSHKNQYNGAKKRTPRSNIHIDVGDQKFISLNSDGFGLKICFVLLLSDLLLSNELSETPCINSSFDSSAIMPTDCDSDRFPSKFDKIQLPWYFSALSLKAPVKYLFCRRRLLFGELLGDVSGDEGNDLLPLRSAGSKPLGHSLLLSSWSELLTPKGRKPLPETIWWATFTTELPHAAASPLKPSSVPLDFIFIGFCWGLTLDWMISERRKKWNQMILRLQWNGTVKQIMDEKQHGKKKDKDKLILILNV